MKLDNDTFTLFAARAYDISAASSIEDFECDVKRFQYIKRLLRRFKESGELKERLILNHVVIIYNCFGEKATNMLFLKMEDYLPEIVPFILLLDRLPDVVVYKDECINTGEIVMNQQVVDSLRDIRSAS